MTGGAPVRPAVRDRTVAVVGLGYVGLPLALAFGREMDTIGFDISAPRVAECSRGVDHTGEAGASTQAGGVAFSRICGLMSFQ